MSKYSERRVIDAEKLRAACIHYDWFTRANVREYNRVLDDAREHGVAGKWIANNSYLVSLMEKIMEYSDPEVYEGMDDTGILFVLANECCTTIFTRENKEEEAVNG